MNTPVYAIPLLITIFFLFGTPAAPAATTYPLIRKDANLNRFIRGLLRDARWRTGPDERTGNTGWILNRQLVSVKEVTHERNDLIR